MKTSPVSDGSLVVDGIIIPNGEQLYTSTLVVHVGNESIEVGLLTGYSSSADGGSSTTPPDELSLAGTLDHLQIVVAGQATLLSGYDLSSVLHT